MSFYAYSALINVLTSLTLFFVVAKKRQKILADKTYILFCLSIAFWSFFYFLWQLTKNADLALLWSRVFMAGAIFIPVFYCHFVLAFLELQKKNKIKIILVYFWGLLSLALNFTPLFVKNVVPMDFVAFWPKPGLYFHLFLTIWFLIFAYTIITSLKVYKNTYNVKRQQIRFILIGILIGIIGGSTNYFLWYGINIKPIGNILISVCTILIGYAIITKKLLDIKLVLRQSSVYIISLLVTVTPLLNFVGYSNCCDSRVVLSKK